MKKRQLKIFEIVSLCENVKNSSLSGREDAWASEGMQTCDKYIRITFKYLQDTNTAGAQSCKHSYIKN